MTSVIEQFPLKMAEFADFQGKSANSAGLV
jgi:hypothetical protein